LYKNRREAGEKLSTYLTKYKETNAILLAIPRGGVPVADVIADNLGLQLDVIIVKKVGHPSNPEYAVGAVTTNSSYINKENIANVRKEYLRNETRKKQEEARYLYRELRGDKPPIIPGGKTVILVDDGVATGSTLVAATNLVKTLDAKQVVIAVPVGSTHTVRSLLRTADEVMCPLQPPMFYAIGQFYEDFSQVPTEQVKEILNKYD
jgi:predicted phosphoribosyltransferase